METIVQYGLSTLVENATVVKTTRNGNTLQNFAPNVLTVKNTYKTGYRIGLVSMPLERNQKESLCPLMQYTFAILYLVELSTDN